MRDKYDFENLVYEKAGTLAAKERKYSGYRKAALSSAAVFTVLIVGSVFVFNGNSVSFDSMSENNAAKAGNENAEVYNEYDIISAEDYGYDSIDMYENDVQEANNDSFDDSVKEEINSSVSLGSENSSSKSAEEKSDDNEFNVSSESTAVSDGVGHIDRVIYEGKDNVIAAADEDVFNDFKEAVNNLQETKTLVDESEESSIKIHIVESEENRNEYWTNISVYGNILEVTYEEIFYSTESNLQENYNTPNNPVKTYYISDEFIRLVRENFDENFMSN